LLGTWEGSGAPVNVSHTIGMTILSGLVCQLTHLVVRTTETAQGPAAAQVTLLDNRPDPGSRIVSMSSDLPANWRVHYAPAKGDRQPDGMQQRYVLSVEVDGPYRDTPVDVGSIQISSDANPGKPLVIPVQLHVERSYVLAPRSLSF